MVSKPNNYVFKKIILRVIAIMFLLMPIEIFILLKFSLYSNELLVELFILTFLIIFIFLTSFTSKELTEKYIVDYNNNHTPSYTTFDEIRFNEFYQCMLTNYNFIFLDNIFSVLNSCVEAKEKQLSKDPEYRAKMIALISILVGLLASIVGGVIPLIVQDLNVKYKLLVILMAVGTILAAYSVLSSLITFQTKNQKLKKSLKDIKVFLYT